MTASPVSGTATLRSHEFDLFGTLRRRLLASLAAIVAWVSLTMLYVAFWARGFSLFQSVVVVLVSLVVLAGFLLGAWISFGLRFMDRWPD